MDLKQGDLENIILNAVWDLENSGTEKIYVGEVQERIKSPAKKWAYTTVKTVLDRLVDKDLAEREKDGKKFFYRSRVKRNEAGRKAIEKVLRQYFQNDVNGLIDCLLKIEPDAPNGHGDKSILKQRQAALQQLESVRQELVRPSAS
ncbi:MAG: BlaI/MecI/CopY family transcriptional regulator [Vampirovibrionales bacterium]|nr:BlaI/MecI/CopY family transcriptional regulator [Vampirovibrionales bacterium]